MRLALPIAVALGVLAPTPSLAAEAWPAIEVRVRLDPATHLLQGRATVRLPGPTPEVMRFTLRDGLAIRSIRVGGVAVEPAVLRSEPEAGGPGDPAAGRAPRRQWSVTWPAAAEQGERSVADLEIEYDGPIAGGIEAAQDLSFVIGDRTSGTIGETGAFLAGDSGWYPDPGTPLALFPLLEVTVPEAWQVASQGDDAGTTVADGQRRTTFRGTLPAPGLSLSAGPYTVTRRDHKGRQLSTYLFAEHASLAGPYLDEAARQIDRFEALLGPYPYSKFDIVENFFSSGYGFPAYTLLGSEVFAMGERALRPGYVDHEIAHCWWGNSVYPVRGDGDWAEGITTYVANYLAMETQDRAAGAGTAARDWRRGVSQKYAVEVPAGRDYPPRRFTGKTTALDDSVGYGKPALFFHQVRLKIGDAAFFAALRRLAREHAGRQAGWDDWRSAFESESGMDLAAEFSQWLDRPGLPRLRLAGVGFRRIEAAGASFEITGTIVQEGEPYRLVLRLRARTVAGDEDETVPVAAASTPFRLRVAALPLALMLDPDWEVARHLEPVERIPGLNVTLADPTAWYIYPDAGPTTWRELAERAAAERGGRAVPASVAAREAGAVDTACALPADRSVWVLGGPDENPWFTCVAPLLAPALWQGRAGWTWHERALGPNGALLASAARPEAPGRFVSLFMAGGEAARERSRLLFFYGWDTSLLFEAGRPVERQTVEPARHPLLHVFTDLLLPEASAATTAAGVSALADPSMGGRLPGTPGQTRARDWIRQALVEAGLKPGERLLKGLDGFDDGFPILVRDLDPDNRIELVRTTASEPLALAPMIFSPPATDTLGRAVELGNLRWVGLAPKPDAGREWGEGRVSGAVVVARIGDPAATSGTDETAAIFSTVALAQSQGARAVILLDDRLSLADHGTSTSPLAPWLVYPSARAPVGRSAAGPDDLRVSGHYARLPIPAATRFDVPVLAGGVEAVRALFGRADLDEVEQPPAPLTLDLALRVRVGFLWRSYPGRNLVGVLLPEERADAGRVPVVLGAHYDHLGTAADGTLFPGAADNAAGVAALLEAARLLVARRALLRRPVLVVAFDGEEWGLRGASHLLTRLLPPGMPGVRAMINIDSVGADPFDRVALIGNTFHPRLAATARLLLPDLGVREGRDLDRFAFAHGSDHYPFHEAGVPVLDLFAADYARLHTPQDTPESVDADQVAAVARLAAALVLSAAADPSDPEREAHP